MGRIDGIDLVSEGILTLSRVSDYLKEGAEKDTVKYQNDGAACLLRLLLDADHTHFMVGQAVNAARQSPVLPHQLGIRMTVVREITEELCGRGREATIEAI